eukprot:4231371-Amphidinium_carterae.1
MRRRALTHIASSSTSCISTKTWGRSYEEIKLIGLLQVVLSLRHEVGIEALEQNTSGDRGQCATESSSVVIHEQLGYTAKCFKTTSSKETWAQLQSIADFKTIATENVRNRVQGNKRCEQGWKGEKA